MRIWVRSQDKEILCECSSFTVSINYSSGIEDGFSIDGSTIDGTVLDMGIYLNKEQAIKVMDMIQDHLESPTYVSGLENEEAHYDRNVFQMPRVEEVDI